MANRAEFFPAGLPQLEKVLEVLNDANKNLLTPSETLRLPERMGAGKNSTLSSVARDAIDNVFATISGVHGGILGGLQISVDNLRGGCFMKPCDHDNRNERAKLCLTKLFDDDSKVPEFVKPKKNRTLEVISMVVPRIHSVFRNDTNRSEDVKMARGAVDSPHDNRSRTLWRDSYPDPLPETYKDIYGVFGREIEYRLGYWLPK